MHNGPYSNFSTLFESEVWGVKWQHFHNKIVNNFKILLQIWNSYLAI